MKFKPLLSFSLLLLPFFAEAKTMCSWDGPMPTYVFWQPELADAPDMRPFYFTFDRFYDYEWSEPAYKYKNNTQEWVEYGSFRASSADVDSVILKGTLNELQQLTKFAKTGENPKGKFKDNVFAQVLCTNKMIAALKYLEYAKKCEQYVYMENEWDENPAKPSEMRKLYQDGQSAYERETDAFLKTRYAFQAIRLAHYAGDNSQAIGMYDKMMEGSSSKSVVKDWALGHKAGALMNMGKRVEALYLYSVAFDKCPSKRVNMYMSFKPSSDEEWEQVLKKCKTAREKSTLYLLRAIDPYAIGLEEMKNIYAIDPKSEYLTLLLAREINKLETNLMGTDFTFQFPIPVNYKAAAEEGSQASSEYLYKFKSFVETMVAEGKVKDMDTWKLAQGYMYYLTGNFEKAKTISSAIAANTSNKEVKQEANVFNFLLKVNDLREINSSVEEKIYQEYLALGVEQRANYKEDWDYEFANKPVYDCMRYKFMDLYNKSKQPGKALLLKEGIYGFYSKNTDVALIDELLEFSKQPKNSFEKYLVELTNGRDNILNIKGTAFLRMGKVMEANAVFQTIGRDYAESDNFLLHSDPFSDKIKDCHECEEEKYAEDKTKNKIWLTNELIRLEKMTNDPATAASAYYKLALGWYNMTYFAPTWRALMFDRASSNWEIGKETPNEYYTQEIIDINKGYVYDDMSKALKYVTAALAASPDKELAAKCNFLIAKCKLNQTYAGTATQSQVNTAYADLKGKYSDTKFYKEAIKECKYFSSFVGN